MTMTRVTLTILILATWVTLATGQNLVINPSFEDTLYCPTSVVGYQQDTTGSVGWFSFRNSPDYYNNCADTPTSIVSVPVNVAGYQYAATGNAYVGMQCYFTSEYREFIGSKLISPLTIGQKYFVSLKVNCAVRGNIGANCAVRQIGTLFSTVPYNSINMAPMNNFAHVVSNSIVTDTVNWINVTGSFTADSTYKYIIIGNFFDDAHTDTFSVIPIPNYRRSYYFIDDICVTTDSVAMCTFTTDIKQNTSSKVSVYPNPTSDQSILRFDNTKAELCTLTLYNHSGQIMRIINNITSDQVVIQKNDLTNGLYYFVLRTNDRVIVTGKLAVD